MFPYPRGLWELESFNSQLMRVVVFYLEEVDLDWCTLQFLQELMRIQVSPSQRLMGMKGLAFQGLMGIGASLFPRVL